jgi:hypothetical protein
MPCPIASDKIKNKVSLCHKNDLLLPNCHILFIAFCGTSLNDELTNISVQKVKPGDVFTVSRDHGKAWVLQMS